MQQGHNRYPPYPACPCSRQAIATVEQMIPPSWRWPPESPCHFGAPLDPDEASVLRPAAMRSSCSKRRDNYVPGIKATTYRRCVPAPAPSPDFKTGSTCLSPKDARHHQQPEQPQRLRRSSSIVKAGFGKLDDLPTFQRPQLTDCGADGDAGRNHSTCSLTDARIGCCRDHQMIHKNRRSAFALDLSLNGAGKNIFAR